MYAVSSILHFVATHDLYAGLQKRNMTAGGAGRNGCSLDYIHPCYLAKVGTHRRDGTGVRKKSKNVTIELCLRTPIGEIAPGVRSFRN